MTPFYDDGLATIWCGDSFALLATIPDESFDIVVTSPPYNMGLTPGGNGRGLYKHSTQKANRFGDGYDASGDDLAPDEYNRRHRDALAHMWRIARLGVIWNHRPRLVHGLLQDPLGGDFGIPLRQRIVLDRGTGIDVNVRHFCTRGEYLYLFAKPDFRLVDHAASGMGDVWRVGIDAANDHPAPFPLIVPARCIAATGAASVLDPFMGSGTTLRAAKDAHVRALGIDVSARYCRMAVARLGQEALSL